MMVTRRRLLTGMAALLLAPQDLLEPRKKLWALGGLFPQPMSLEMLRTRFDSLAPSGLTWNQFTFGDVAWVYVVPRQLSEAEVSQIYAFCHRLYFDA